MNQRVNTDSVDLLRLIGGRLKLASRNTNEHYRSCPKCGGKDRFRIFPATNRRQGRFWCRQCGWNGDAIEFVMWRDNCGFIEALDRLGIDDISTEDEARVVDKVKQEPLRNLDVDSYGYSKDFPKHAKEFLFRRGISMDVARDYLLYDKDGVNGRIAIPCKMHGLVPYIKLRAIDPSDKYKWMNATSDLPGRKTCVYMIGELKPQPAIVTESELDALMLETHRRMGGYSVTIYAIGGVTQNFDMWDSLVFLHGNKAFSAFDNDKAGQKCTSKWGLNELIYDLECKDLGELYERHGSGAVDKLFSQMFARIKGVSDD